MKRLGLVIALLLVVGTAQAAIETIKVSGDINLQAVTRGNLNLGGGMRFNGSSWIPMVGHDNTNSFLMSQIRLRFDADLTENVFATVGLIYEGDWGKESEAEQFTNAQGRRSGKQSTVGLDLGYITLKDFLQDGITVVAGRQPLRYGMGLIIGDPDTNQLDAYADKSTYQNAGFTGAGDLSLRKGFDAVKVSVDMAPFKYDVFYALLAEGNYHQNDDVSLYGVYGSYDVGSKNFVIEPYIIVKDGAVADILGYDAGPVYIHQKILTGGVRVGGNPIDNLMVSFEGAYQTGNVNSVKATTAAGDIALGGYKDRQHAFAIQAIAQYMFKKQYSPSLSMSYSYYSREWDPMAEDQTSSELVNLICAQTNAHVINASFSMMPREDLTVTLGYAYYWLAKSIPAFFSRGTGAYYTMDAEKQSLGGEASAKLVYDYTEDVQFSLAGGWFDAGRAFDRSNRETAYTARGGVKVIF